MSKKRKQVDFSGGDEVAIGLALFTMIFSLSSPFLAALTPSFAASINGDAHLLPGIFTVLVSLIVLGVGFDFHCDKKPLFLGITGILLMLSNAALPVGCCSAIYAVATGEIPILDVPALNWATFFLAPLAALVLISAHCSNRRILKERLNFKKSH